MAGLCVGVGAAHSSCLELSDELKGVYVKSKAYSPGLAFGQVDHCAQQYAHGVMLEFE